MGVKSKSINGSNTKCIKTVCLFAFVENGHSGVALLADRGVVERARRRQLADRRLRYVEAPRHVGLRVALVKPLNRFLPLVGLYELARMGAPMTPH